MSSVIERKYAEVDDPKAIDYLLRGRECLVNSDYQRAMRNFKKSNKLKITKALAILLLDQMANCMDKLEYYDQQQTFLEELCELDLNFSNVNQLMKIYNDTNNQEKKSAFISKIKELPVDDEDQERQAIMLLAQAKGHNEVISRCLEWLKKKPDDKEIAKYVFNSYMEQKNIEDAYGFITDFIEHTGEDEFYMELSGLHKAMFDFEAGRDYLFKHFKKHETNTYGINKLAYTLMTSACQNGILNNEDYVYWANRAKEGTRPIVPINYNFDIDTSYFRRIRVGLVSYDFRLHSVGKFISALFNSIPHNTGIETYCYYTYPDHEDNVTNFLKGGADVFKFVGRYSNKQLRKELLDDNLDILIDLNGQTVGSKLSLLAERFAPIQVTWMGYPFSSFYFNIDYIIGDYYFDPVDGETGKYCTEKILRMDPCYMCFALYADYYIYPEPPQTYNGYITFGMMNNPDKYSEEAIRLWQKCLEAVPDSRLLIQLSAYQGPFVEEKFIARLEKYGLDMSRVDLGRDYGQEGYYGTYNKVDVMLDSLPFGGGTTTPEAIWMGVPVIGCQYHMRHGRMAYTFMTQVGLGHLCADSVDTYPDKVREVSQNVELLRELRQNLRDRLTDSALFDTSIFRVAFENAMRDAFVTHCVNNKKPFDTNYYEGEDKILLRDCVRAADIILYEINRQHGKDEERFFELLKEYKRLHRFMLERLSEIFIEDKNSLVIAVKINELMEILTRATNNAAISSSVKAIKALLLKFTVRG